MHTQRAILSFAPLLHLAFADYPPQGTEITFWKNAGCNPDDSAQLGILMPNEDNACLEGTYDEHWNLVENDPSVQVAYTTAEGLPAGCTLGILQQSPTDPDHCGTAYDRIEGGKSGTCFQTALPIQGGVALCCDGVGAGCVVIPPLGTTSVESAANKTQKRSDIKDVTVVKRTLPFSRLKKRDCAFVNTTDTYVSGGRQVIVASGIDCVGGAGSAACTFEKDTTITVGSENSFGVENSITAGTDFFVDIQDTITFSYTYTYSESTSQSSSYTVTVPAGQSGYITWQPSEECVGGYFTGDCAWDTSDGVACIPLFVTGTSGEPQGNYAFLREQ